MYSDISFEEINCYICNVPTKYETRGIIMVNTPILILALGTAFCLYLLNGRRK